MEDSFSYENDIAPLQGRYFSALNTAGLSDQQRLREKSNLVSLAGTLENDRLQRQRARVSNALMDQRFEMNKIALTEARDNAKRSREANLQVGGIVDQLVDIRSMDASAEEKRDLTSQLMLERSDLVVSNPTIRSAFNTALGSYGETLTEKRAKQNRSNGLLNSLIASGNTGAARVFLRDHDDPDEANKILGVVEEIEKSNNARGQYAQDLANAKSVGALTKEHRETLGRRLVEFEKDIKGIEFEVDARTQKATSNLTPASRARLKRIIGLMNPDPKANPLSDAEWDSILGAGAGQDDRLQAMAMEMLKRAQQSNSGFVVDAPQASSVASKFTQ